MTTRATTGPTARVRFANGDLLTAADLAAAGAEEAAQRAIHLRALHGTWGIALGLHVGASDAGDRLIVGPGVAYDACGRELTLDHPLVLAVPAAPAGVAGIGSWFDLVVRAEGRDAAFRFMFAGARTAAADPAPLPATEIRLGEELLVARVLVNPTGHVATPQAAAPDYSLRRVTRSMEGRVLSGRVEKGQKLDWAAHDNWWERTVDYSFAHFEATPHFFVTLDEHPLLGRAPFAAAISQIYGPFFTIFPTKFQAKIVVRFGLSTGSTFAWPTATFTTLPTALRWIAVATPARREPPIVLGNARFSTGDRVQNAASLFTQLRLYPPPGGVTP